jgi:PII-like signaling protein
MEHERFEGERTLMRIHIGESDRWHGKPLYDAIVELLRKAEFGGVTVLRGVGGFGSSSVYHTDEMISGGLVTLEKVRVILYRSHK